LVLVVLLVETQVGQVHLIIHQTLQIIYRRLAAVAVVLWAMVMDNQVDLVVDQEEIKAHRNQLPLVLVIPAAALMLYLQEMVGVIMVEFQQTPLGVVLVVEEEQVPLEVMAQVAIRPMREVVLVVLD
tara:strand:- start:302 stop:682 length:381 start_codon:yes stop_codon:yes gene_type:complete